MKLKIIERIRVFLNPFLNWRAVATGIDISEPKTNTPTILIEIAIAEATNIEKIYCINLTLTPIILAVSSSYAIYISLS